MTKAGGDSFVTDLLFASSGIEGEVVHEAEAIEVFPDLDLPVASLSHLIALKVLARDDMTRPQDRTDLVALLSEATENDLTRARDSLELISARGFARRKDLLAELDAALRELRRC